MGLFDGATKNAGSVETKKFYTDFGQLLVDGEIIEVGFVVLRDTFWSLVSAQPWKQTFVSKPLSRY